MPVFLKPSSGDEYFNLCQSDKVNYNLPFFD